MQLHPQHPSSIGSIRSKGIIPFALLCILGFLYSACASVKDIPVPLVSKESQGKAAVVSAHPLATQVGVDILNAGGTAIDAAIAVEFALAVVYPNAGNIGGGGFLVLRKADSSMLSLDYRETAPAAANASLFVNAQGQPLNDKIRAGHLSAGIPGTVDGMWKLHQAHGTLPWKKLLQPAIDLAEQGFIPTPRAISLLNENQADFKKYNTQPNAFEGHWDQSKVLRQPQLAATLRLIRDQGRDGFYAGKTAEAIVAEMQRGQGLITLADLKGYQAQWRAPIIGTMGEYTILSMGPPSSGGIALMQLLGITQGFELGEIGMHEAQSVQIMAEAEKLVFADRAIHLADPAFHHVPQEALLNTRYLQSRARMINTRKATPSEQISSGIQAPRESDQTTHYVVADAKGNVVSATTTLNNNYGSKVVVGGAGFFLNSTMDDFSIQPGAANMFGLVGSRANRIQPGKRMLSSMTPTIVLKNYQPFLALGSPGGPTIITSVFQVLANRIIFGKSLQESVAAPRFHHQWKPDELYVEAGRFNPQLLEALQARGYKITTKPVIGAVEALEFKADGTILGVADPRGDDSAGGVK